MKPFDLEAAKRGEKLVTRDGREVSEFHHFESINGEYRCIAVIGGERNSYTMLGCFNASGYAHSDDLFMAAKKRTVFVNVYDHVGSVGDDKAGTMAYAFHTEKGAHDNVKLNAWRLLAIAKPVEIEE